MTDQVTLGELNRRFDHAYEQTSSLIDYVESHGPGRGWWGPPKGHASSTASRTEHCFYCGSRVRGDQCPGCGARTWDRRPTSR